jgi:molecular chaperone GrpE
MTEENTEAETKEEVDQETQPEVEVNDGSTEEFVDSATVIEELNNKHLRLVAEFDNFRRRTAKENLELIESANHKLLGKLTEVVENFERANSQDSESVQIEDYKEGVRLIQDQLWTVLKGFGLEEINPVNEAFNPNLHEALMQQPSAEVEANHVVTVFQKGFKAKNKVIQHAKVIVSSGPAAE